MIQRLSFPSLEVMPTLVSSAWLWFSGVHRRWLTPDEALMVQGFPVRAHWSYGQQCCSFATRHAFETGAPSAHTIDEESLSLLKSSPGRQPVFKMAGNSMHTNVSGVSILFALTQVLVDSDLLKLLSGFQQMERNPRIIKKHCL